MKRRINRTQRSVLDASSSSSGTPSLRHVRTVNDQRHDRRDETLLQSLTNADARGRRYHEKQRHQESECNARPAPGRPINQRRERLLCLGQLLEEIEDERVSLVRPFQRDEVRSARDFNVAGARYVFCDSLAMDRRQSVVLFA